MWRIPLSSRRVSRVTIGSVGLLSLFFGLCFFIKASTLTILLNGIFIGTLTAIFITYWSLIWDAFKGVGYYDRVRQMILGFTLCWIAVVLSVLVGINIRIQGGSINSNYFIAASRYAAIIAAILQVSAPDFGLGFFYGLERKALWVGALIGAIVGVVLILAQNFSVLETWAVWDRIVAFLG